MNVSSSLTVIILTIPMLSWLRLPGPPDRRFHLTGVPARWYCVVSFFQRECTSDYAIYGPFRLSSQFPWMSHRLGSMEWQDYEMKFVEKIQPGIHFNRLRKTTKKPQSGWSTPGTELDISRMWVVWDTTKPPRSVKLSCKLRNKIKIQRII